MAHPLDPMTADEMARASKLMRAHAEWNPLWRVVFVLPDEVDKSDLEHWEASGERRPARTALLVVRDKSQRRNLEVRINLDTETVEVAEVDGVQPSIMREESVRAEELARASEEWQNALRARGVVDPSLAMLDHMPISYQDDADGPQKRLGIALTWIRSEDPEDNGYARPVEGLVVYFDLDSMVILRVQDEGGPEIPTLGGNYTGASLDDPDNISYAPTGVRAPLAPLEVVQPEGPGFSFDGWRLSWQRWDLRIGFNAREGLVLYQVGYMDGDRRRPIMYRASLSEMFVPYADPAVTHFRKQLFDQGESGLGRTLNSLRLGCDCVGDITYLDGVYNDNDGNPVVLPNAICIHEEDDGVLWRHTNLRTRTPESRRSRRLVVSTFATVGNYDYGFFWYFYLDGGIEFEAKLTGILSTGAVVAGEQPAHGSLLTKQLYAPNHQHWFNIRLDMTVDGPLNQLVEVNSHPEPDPAINFFGGAWSARADVLETELSARRDVDTRASRFWCVANPNEVNLTGGAPAYGLFPGENCFHFYQPTAPALARAGFIDHHLWATKYRPGELYAAGDYPNQHPGGAGLPSWTAGDERIVNEDLVVWYTFGVHHVPRPEDWPIMPVVRAGFHLKPVGFFAANPSVDLAAEDPVHASDGHCEPSVGHEHHTR